MGELNKFQEGKIYKIICDDFDKIYIGSTVQKLSQRLASHKAKQCCYSKELFEYPNVRIELIEQYPCNSKDELTKREQYYINENRDICINNKNAYISKEDAKERDRLHLIEYYRLNRDVIREQQKEKMICECGVEINKNHKQRHIETEKHIELMKLNDAERLEKLNEKTKCECGLFLTVYRNRDIERHNKTTKHIELMKLKN
jgi:hypothetical protein